MAQAQKVTDLLKDVVNKQRLGRDLNSNLAKKVRTEKLKAKFTPTTQKDGKV